MTRLPRLRPAELDPDQRALYDTLTDGPRHPPLDEHGGLHGPFNALLLSPSVGAALQSVGAALRFDCSLPPRLRELATLQVAVHCASEFELHAHEQLARTAGVTSVELDAIRAGHLPPLTDPAESAAVEFTAHLLAVGDGTDIGAAAYTAAVSALGAPTVFELSTLIGYYRLLAVQMRLFGVTTPWS